MAFKYDISLNKNGMFMLCLAIAGYWEELAALAGGILTAAMQQQDFRLQLISMQNIAQTNLKYLLKSYIKLKEIESFIL